MPTWSTLGVCLSARRAPGGSPTTGQGFPPCTTQQEHHRRWLLPFLRETGKTREPLLYSFLTAPQTLTSTAHRHTSFLQGRTEPSPAGTRARVQISWLTTAVVAMLSIKELLWHRREAPTTFMWPTSATARWTCSMAHLPRTRLGEAGSRTAPSRPALPLSTSPISGMANWL